MDSVTATLKQSRPVSPQVFPQKTSDPAANLQVQESVGTVIPQYMQDIYYWAYLNPRNVRWLDHELIVKLILWNQHARLRSSVFAEIKPGQQILQSTCVYGKFLPMLADLIGPSGHLSLVDIATVQLEAAQRKLNGFQNVSLHHADVLKLDDKLFDAVICYFLLHEIPDRSKQLAVNVLLKKVKPGGKLIFIDYHKPHWAHPLKPITSLVFDTLEPFAKGMWRHEIREFAQEPDLFTWRKERFFGSLFQKVVAERR
jgi:ubiquinone/menaquinone biosynthesis C-methylase UbiE